jgi:hypothetical protein
MPFFMREPRGEGEERKKMPQNVVKCLFFCRGRCGARGKRKEEQERFDLWGKYKMHVHCTTILSPL